MPRCTLTRAFLCSPVLGTLSPRLATRAPPRLTRNRGAGHGGLAEDVHWSGGALGYFPTYSLGAMYATQIYECAKEELGANELEEDISKGNFTRLRSWLQKRIHSVGSFHLNGDELMKAVTGKPLDPQIFLKYLRTKYSEIYQLP